MRIVFFGILAAWVNLAFAKTSAKEVDQVLAAYRRAPAVQAKIKKTVLQETIGSQTESEGEFYFSKGKLRLDVEQPEKTTLVYDGKVLWLEDRTDDQHIVVTKMRGSNLKKSDSILASLFDKKNVLKAFKLTKTDHEAKDAVYSFEPKDKKKSDVSFLQIAVERKNIQRITYKDQMDNKVTLEFSDVKRGKVDAAKFKYSPPKKADITEL